jgi:putative phage-type endonuclease
MFFFNLDELIKLSKIYTVYKEDPSDQEIEEIIKEKLAGIKRLTNCWEYIEFTKNQPEQKSIEWLNRRKKCLTASDVAKVTKARNMTKNKTVENLIKDKKNICKNKFRDNIYTRWGERYEDVAVLLYENLHNVKVYEAALQEHPIHTRIGASCDGFIPLTGDAECLEIKCPATRIPEAGHIKTEYYEQMQTQLFVTNFEICNFYECQVEEWDGEEEFLEDINNFLGIVNGTIIDSDITKEMLEEIKGSPKNYGILVQLVDTNNEKNKKLDQFAGLTQGYTDITDINTTDIDPDNYYDVTPSHIYSEIISEDLSNYGKIKEDLDNKLTKILSENKNLIYVRYKWWKLQKYTDTRVPRDPEWFPKNKPKFDQFWDMVDGYPTDDKKLNKKLNKKIE